MTAYLDSASHVRMVMSRGRQAFDELSYKYIIRSARRAHESCRRTWMNVVIKTREGVSRLLIIPCIYSAPRCPLRSPCPSTWSRGCQRRSRRPIGSCLGTRRRGPMSRPTGPPRRPRTLAGELALTRVRVSPGRLTSISLRSRTWFSKCSTNAREASSPMGAGAVVVAVEEAATTTTEATLTTVRTTTTAGTITSRAEVTTLGLPTRLTTASFR